MKTFGKTKVFCTVYGTYDVIKNICSAAERSQNVHFMLVRECGF